MMLCVIPEKDASCMQIDKEPFPIDPQLQLVIDKYAEVFATPTELPPQREHDHRIPLIDGVVPFNIRP